MLSIQLVLLTLGEIVCMTSRDIVNRSIINELTQKGLPHHCRAVESHVPFLENPSARKLPVVNIEAESTPTFGQPCASGDRRPWPPATVVES